MKRKRLFAVGMFALVAGAVAMALLASRPSPETGPLRTVKGLRVLFLDGTPREMGYTHGYCLAADIMAGGDFYIRMLPMLQKPVARESLLKLLKLGFRRPESYQEEIEGMLDGMRERLGDDGLRLDALGRKITVDDLWALNTANDWNRMGCSSFSAWGAMTSDGQVITARNLDYAGREVIERTGIVFVRRPVDPARKSWVSFGFAGTIGCYTGMNSDGVVIATHDSDSTGKSLPPYYPQGFVLRECIETVSSDGDVVAATAAVFRRHKLYSGCNIHVSMPAPPAVIAEYDGRTGVGLGVTLRFPKTGDDWIACANAFHVRAGPSYDCPRYAKLVKRLGGMAGRGTKVDGPDDAWEIISLTGVDWTLCTTVLKPAARTIRVAHATRERPAHLCRPVDLSVDELVATEVAEPVRTSAASP